MGTAERRMAIMKELCRRRHVTINHLALKFGVSPRTIQRDIDILSGTEPIFTLSGRYNGGIYVVEGYSIDRMYMAKEELDLLHKLYAIADENASLLTVDEKKLLGFLISQYSKPISKS